MQSIIPETLLSLQHDPHGLETTYREQPDAFARALSVALDRDPESLALRARPSGWRPIRRHAEMLKKLRNPYETKQESIHFEV